MLTVRLVLTLGLVAVFSSSWAMGFSEGFESYAPGTAIAGANGWQETGLGDWFEAEATVAGDPGVLGARYAELTRNGHGPQSNGAWLWHALEVQTAGLYVVECDVKFTASEELSSCSIFLNDSARTPGFATTLQAVAITVDADGLRIHDGDWRIVNNFSLENHAWYHATITVDLDARTWQLAMAKYTGDVPGSPVTVSYDAGDDTFAFRDSAVDDLGMIEFFASPAIMNDSLSRGFAVDNVIPEPTALSLLALSALAIRRRRTT